MENKSFEIIIPAYNEEENMAQVINGIKSVLGEDCRIIVVDDASCDRTAEVASSCGAKVIRHPYRIGNGASVKTGLRNSTADIVVLMDADGQHEARYIPFLLEAMDKFDMVIGARDFSRLTLRNIANRLYNRFSSYITLFNIRDLTCGFRAVKRKFAVQFLNLLPNSFSYPSTLTLSFLKTGRPISFIPVSTISRHKGKSKINLMKDGMRFIIIILRIATFFSPLRVFVPVSLFFFFGGIAYYLYTFINFHRFTNMSALLLTTSIIIFMLGLISEQISQLRIDRTQE